MLPTQNVRILCVDDDAGITTILQRVLESAGYTVDVAANGQVALNRISKNLAQYPLIITDMRMPALDGYGLIAEARAVGYAGVFIALAGGLAPDDRQRLRELRVSRILDKPARAATIIDAVREALTGY